MTQEKKAKAYDEALDRAKKELQTCGSTDCDAARQIFRFFPELRESEDERIRKALIEGVRQIRCKGDVTQEQMLAYLEKQKETLHILEMCKENANSFTDGVIEVRSFQRGLEEGRRLERQKKCVAYSSKISADEDGKIRARLIEYFKGFLEGFEDCYKDGGCVKWEGLDVKSILAYLEKQKENANSFTDGVIEVRSFQRGIEEGRRLERQKDASKAIEAVERIDKYINEHLANAHDMKDSDPDKKYYRGWDDAFAEVSGILQDVYSEKENKFAPRVLPCSAAWFEDDDERQKEQKPVQSEEEKEYVRTLKGLVSDFIRDSGGGITDIEYYQNICDWLDGRHIEQKPAEWDDYTKTNLGRAIQIIKDARGTLHGYQTDDGIYECDKAIEALEHFLYRGLEIEKSAEWSEEDEEMLNSCISSIEESKENRYAYKENDGDTSYDHEIAWLKSLRLQPKQEWSKEDEKDMAHIIRILDDCCVYGIHDLSKTDHENLVNKLKSLRPQSKDEIYKEKNEAFKLGKQQLAIGFINYLDDNRPKSKMISNGECEDIDKAFKENDWAKILRYAEKYGK